MHCFSSSSSYLSTESTSELWALFHWVIKASSTKLRMPVSRHRFVCLKPPEMLPCPVQPVAGPSTDLGQKLEVVVDSALLSGIASPEATSRGCLRQSRSRRRSRFVPMPISQAPSSSLVKYKIFMISIRYSQSFVLVYFFLLRLT